MDDLLLIVKPIEMDRQMRLEGYEIESLFHSGLSERVPSGVMHSPKALRLSASAARLSVMLVCLLLHTGIPPIFLKIGPSGQKNHSFS